MEKLDTLKNILRIIFERGLIIEKLNPNIMILLIRV